MLLTSLFGFCLKAGIARIPCMCLACRNGAWQGTTRSEQPTPSAPSQQIGRFECDGCLAITTASSDSRRFASLRDFVTLWAFAVVNPLFFTRYHTHYRILSNEEQPESNSRDSTHCAIDDLLCI